MLSIAVDVMHQIINIGQQTAKMVSVLNSGSDSHYPIVFNSQYRDSTFSIETLNKASVSFDNEVGQVFSREKIEASITRFAELVPYKNSLSSKSGIPPAATELLTASSVYPLIIPDGHIGRSQYAPLKGLPGLYMAIAECTPSDGPLPHAHYDSQESFFVLDGDWDITWGYEDEFRIPVKPYDLVAMPDQVMRSFKNTGKNKGWLFVIIQGQEKMSDIVAYSPEVGKIVEERYGADVIHAYQKVNITFDAERC
jgi:mannose-6-phosphate isomerase-like protein (cupin superfamily)